ncbi:hypothetical protein ACTWP6_23680 [Mycobacterium sp. 4D054]|uniref:hypothetical protein n=1 Tax=Mycobacterium sp. 4D054 TaxID=3457440 RepID=UPI003FD39043
MSFAEDLNVPALLPAVEAYLARQREWHWFLRGTGAVTADEAVAELARWMSR